MTWRRATAVTSASPSPAPQPEQAPGAWTMTSSGASVSATADVVVAGELFEHVADLETAVAEVSRVLRPGGVVVVDTISASRRARLGLVSVGGVAPWRAAPEAGPSEGVVPVEDQGTSAIPPSPRGSEAPRAHPSASTATI